MPRATRKVTMEDSSLKGLKRSQLQALAKVYGIKANGKTEVIIKSLLANKAYVDSRRESSGDSSKSSASVQFSPNIIEPQPRRKSGRYRMPTPMPSRQGVVEVDQNIPEVKAVTPQDMMEVKPSLGNMLDEEQVLVQDVINKLQILNQETGSILDKKVEGFKKMIWTRQILEHLCNDHRWDGTQETLQAVWRRYSKEIEQ